jgi:hypothetical protein
MSPRLLEGQVLDPKDQEIDRLERRIEDLQADLVIANTKAEKAERNAARAVGALRKQLQPLYRALQMVFDEIDSTGFEESPSGSQAAAGVSSRATAILNDWKSKNPTSDGKILDALLLHPDLSVKQMVAICKMGQDTVYAATSRMGRGGILVKNGGRFSLAVK